MNITFHGAARVVTGSKHLLQLNSGTRLLLDCGMFQGMGHAEEGLNANFGFDPAGINYMVLSHAHIDHVGLLPRLIAQGYTGPVFATPATMDLARILLLDSARIQQQDYEYLSRHNKHAEPPLYTEEDVHNTLGRFTIVPYNTAHVISPEIEVTFTDAGHIVGSAAVSLKLTQGDGHITRITFSGDVGRYNNVLLSAPAPFPPADYIICESTYGDSLHKISGDTDDVLKDIINDTCVRRGGNLIIPAFSVGRTQELLYALNNLYNRGLLPAVKYFVDSPLSREATQVMQKHTENYNPAVQQVLASDADIFAFPGLAFTQSVEESKAINNLTQPAVIIAASGMAEAGRIQHHIKNNIGNARNTILIVGYCEPRSLGGKLTAGASHVTIFGEEYQVNAQVKVIQGMSAHGDYKDLLRFLSCQPPQQVKTVFLVHGEYDVQQHFAATLQQQGFPQVVIPQFHQSFTL